MDANSSVMTELYDIKRQNADWEIKLEENTHFLADQLNDQLNDHLNGQLEQPVHSEHNLDFTWAPIAPNSVPPDSANNHSLLSRLAIRTDLKPILVNGNGSVAEKRTPKTNSPKTRRSPSNQEYDGIKNVEQFVERRKINGITWYYCLWQNCSYGSNKSNHLVIVCSLLFCLTEQLKLAMITKVLSDLITTHRNAVPIELFCI